MLGLTVVRVANVARAVEWCRTMFAFEPMRVDADGPSPYATYVIAGTLVTLSETAAGVVRRRDENVRNPGLVLAVDRDPEQLAEVAESRGAYVDRVGASHAKRYAWVEDTDHNRWSLELPLEGEMASLVARFAPSPRVKEVRSLEVADHTTLVSASLPVRNVGATAEWYREMLGLLPLRVGFDGDTPFAAYRAGEMLFTVSQQRDLPTRRPNESHRNTYLLFMVDDVDASAAVLRRRGVPMGEMKESANNRFLWVYDPDGHRLELSTPITTEYRRRAEAVQAGHA